MVTERTFPTQGIGCSTFALKMIAIVSMLIDHIGAILYPQYMILRMIGRLAFPIYCFLLVEGFFHTRSIKKYEIRMLLFALVSEIPYDLAFYKKLVVPENQNVFFTLLLGLLLIQILDRLSANGNQVLFKVASVVIIAFVAEAIGCDYGMQGIMVIAMFYLFHDYMFGRNVAFALVEIGFNTGNQIQMLSVVSLLPISLYNGKKGPSCKFLFYAFYPVHLLILYAVWRFAFEYGINV